MSLTARQERFASEYLVDLNATQAAIRAGFSAKTAEAAGSRLLRNVKVSAVIAAAKAERLKRVEITQDRVLLELALLAFSDVQQFEEDDGDVKPTADAPPGATRALSSVKRRTTTDTKGNVTREVEFKLWDKPSALRMAGRHVGLFPDRVELTGKNGEPIRVEDERADRTAVFAVLKKLAGEKTE